MPEVAVQTCHSSRAAQTMRLARGPCNRRCNRRCPAPHWARGWRPMHPTSGIKTTKIEQACTRITRNPSYLRGIYLQWHESTDLLLSTASVCKNLQNANLDLPVKVSIKTLHGRAWPWRTKEGTRSSQNSPRFSIDSDRHSWVTGMERDLQMSLHSKTLRKANWCPARCHPPLRN